MQCADATLLERMQTLVREAAEPAVPGESVKAAIYRAAQRLGLSFDRARRHWYGQARSIPASEWLAVHQAHQRLMRQEAARLRQRIALLEHRIQAGDDRGPTAFGGSFEAAAQSEMPAPAR